MHSVAVYGANGAPSTVGGFPACDKSRDPPVLPALSIDHVIYYDVT